MHVELLFCAGSHHCHPNANLNAQSPNSVAGKSNYLAGKPKKRQTRQEYRLAHAPLPEPLQPLDPLPAEPFLFLQLICLTGGEGGVLDLVLLVSPRCPWEPVFPMFGHMADSRSFGQFLSEIVDCWEAPCWLRNGIRARGLR